MAAARGPTERRQVHPLVDLLGAYSWRLIGIGVAALALLWLLARLRVVMIPIVIALFLSRALAPMATWLRNHGWRPGLAAVATLLAFLLLLAGLSAAIAQPLADEARSLGPTVTEAFDDMEKWLVEDSPFDISRRTVDRLRQQTGSRVDDLLSVSGGAVVDGATIAAEVVAAIFLSLLLTFFMLSDGDRFTAWTLRQLPSQRQATVRRAGARAWSTIGGYLRGAALLGFVEATVIGITLFLSGGGLVVPVVTLTFGARSFRSWERSWPA